MGDRDGCRGILFIGDPHLSSRIPGFRKDDAPKVFLGKLRWCLDHARSHRLLPAILGDLFHLPRDNDNWLLGEVLDALGGREVIAIAGNHDCREDEVTDHDSLSVLVKAGRIRLVDREGPWRGTIGGRRVVVGGTSWGDRLPESFDPRPPDGPPPLIFEPPPLVFWMAHHDVKVPGYEEEGRFRPREIPGIDVVVNGHIHRSLDDVRAGRTLWITPGNIVRVARSDLTRAHRPAALRIDVDESGWRREAVEVPHRPYEEVFHPDAAVEEGKDLESAFVRGLAELVARRTETGAGLVEFLERNLSQFEEEVAREIRSLAKEVTADDGSKKVGEGDS